MKGKFLVEWVADCLPMTMLCDCREEYTCTYCLNLAGEIINNLWNLGFEIKRREDGS